MCQAGLSGDFPEKLKPPPPQQVFTFLNKKGILFNMLSISLIPPAVKAYHL